MHDKHIDNQNKKPLQKAFSTSKLKSQKMFLV